MARPKDDYAALGDLAPSQWPGYLEQHSGLPGPRANLELLDVVARTATPEAVAALLDHGGEYQVACAAAALGKRAQESEARALAADQRWRVREGVAIGLQLLGDDNAPRMTEIVLDWVNDPDPLVQRAAAAAICEPRLLKDPRVAEVALEVCDRATKNLQAMDGARRKLPDARTLRQGLAYCWSVAIAAAPGRGLPLFRSLDTSDPDVAWVVAQNSKKKRLAGLLG